MTLTPFLTIEHYIIIGVHAEVTPGCRSNPEESHFVQVVHLAAKGAAHDVTVAVLDLDSVYAKLQGEPLYGPAFQEVTGHLVADVLFVWGRTCQGHTWKGIK